MTSQSPATTGYSYDARNRVKTASTGSATTTFDYYLDGKKKTVTYPNTAKEEYEYYQTNRVKTLTSSINGSLLSKFDYSYDANGNRLTQDESRLWGNGTGTVRQSQSRYSYDSLDRMTSYSITENSATTKTDYTFEGYNRKTETTTKPDNTAVTKTYTYDETDWLTQINSSTVSGTGTSATSQSLGYDNNGNTISKTDSADPANPTTYAYDSRDKLISASKGGINLGHYSYNANGYRIRQLNSDRGDLDYYYDGTAVIEERNAGGLLAHYRYAGKLYSLTDGTSNQYYHQDALGSTTDLTDDTGATKASYFLNPWGMIVDSIGNSVNRRVFTGKEIDQNTGLIYFGARYYDADTARFTTQDSYLGKQDEPPSLHRYLYAYSNPTVYVDLEGYYSWKKFENDVTKVADGGKKAWEGTKTAVKTTWKALPQLNQKFSSGFDQALDNAYGTALQNNVPGMKNPLVQAGITAGITGTKTMLGMGSYPLVKAGQMSEYTADPTQLQNFPLLGTGLRDTYRAHKAFEQNPTLENGLQVFQAGAGTFLEAVGVGYGAKTIKGSYGKTAPKSGMTVEAGTTKILTGDKKIVIGENMERVKPYADKIGAEIYEGMPGFKPGMEAEGLLHNKSIIQLKMLEGYKIIDIGPDFSRRSIRGSAQPAYEMERTVTKGYEGYEKAFIRTGKDSLILPEP